MQSSFDAIAYDAERLQLDEQVRRTVPTTHHDVMYTESVLNKADF
jgi:hypothetical protein